jgi:hypothetical protein
MLCNLTNKLEMARYLCGEIGRELPYGTNSEQELRADGTKAWPRISIE